MRVIKLALFVVLSLNLFGQTTVYENRTDRNKEELCEERGHLWVYESRGTFTQPINKLIDDSTGTYRVKCGGIKVIKTCERCKEVNRGYSECDTSWIYPKPPPLLHYYEGDLSPEWWEQDIILKRD